MDYSRKIAERLGNMPDKGDCDRSNGAILIL